MSTVSGGHRESSGSLHMYEVGGNVVISLVLLSCAHSICSAGLVPRLSLMEGAHMGVLGSDSE